MMPLVFSLFIFFMIAFQAFALPLCANRVRLRLHSGDEIEDPTSPQLELFVSGNSVTYAKDDRCLGLGRRQLDSEEINVSFEDNKDEDSYKYDRETAAIDINFDDSGVSHIDIFASETQETATFPFMIPIPALQSTSTSVDLPSATYFDGNLASSSSDEGSIQSSLARSPDYESLDQTSDTFLDMVDNYESTVTTSINLYKSLSIISLFGHFAHAISLAFSRLTRCRASSTPSSEDFKSDSNTDNSSKTSHKANSEHKCDVEDMA